MNLKLSEENRELNNERERIKDDITEKQNTFMKTNIGIAINKAIDYGLKKILPDFIEDKVIGIKDALLNEGIKEGIDTAIEGAIDLGKSVIGLFTGKFDKISQIEAVVQKGGLLKSTSDLLDESLKRANKKELINDETTNIIKQGKNIIKNSLSQNLEDLLMEQKKLLKKIENYAEKWKEYYIEKDIENMQKQYEKIKNTLENAVPIQETISKVQEIENIHKLIKNNGGNFEITENQIELAKKLI